MRISSSGVMLLRKMLEVCCYSRDVACEVNDLSHYGCGSSGRGERGQK